jgi:AcrR family transcriptional regulator
MQPGTAPDEPERTFIETARRAQIAAAAIDTIAEVGYVGASFARIAERAGISRGLISYHFAGKDELITQVVSEIIEQGKAYMTPRILAERPGPDMLRAYIESNLSFMREHRNYMVAMAEIARNGLTADGRQRFYGDADMEGFARDLQDALAGLQAGGDLRPDFDPRVMALAIRAAIDAVARRLAHDPDLDIDNYARELARLFELVTRVVE